MVWESHPPNLYQKMCVQCIRTTAIEREAAAGRLQALLVLALVMGGIVGGVVWRPSQGPRLICGSAGDV